MSAGKKILIILLFGVIAWVAYFFMYFQPKQEEVAELLTKLQDVRIEMQSKRAIANNLPRFNRELEVLRAQLRESLSQLPDSRNVPELLESFSSLAGSSGVRINKFTVGPETVRGFYAELPVNLELMGGFHNIAIFFDKIGKLERIVNISNVGVRNPRHQEGETLVTVTCLATTFRFLEREALQ